MWSFVLVTAFVAIVLTLLSWMAEQHLEGEPNRTTPGYALLPGDIKIKRGNVRLYVPITTSIVVSVVLTLLLWLLG